MKVNTQQCSSDLKRLLPRGALAQIGTELGLSRQAVGLALKAGKPGHPAVQRALAMALESGAIAAAGTLSRLSATP